MQLLVSNTSSKDLRVWINFKKLKLKFSQPSESFSSSLEIRFFCGSCRSSHHLLFETVALKLSENSQENTGEGVFFVSHYQVFKNRVTNLKLNLHCKSINCFLYTRTVVLNVWNPLNVFSEGTNVTWNWNLMCFTIDTYHSLLRLHCSCNLHKNRIFSPSQHKFHRDTWTALNDILTYSFSHRYRRYNPGVHHIDDS